MPTWTAQDSAWRDNTCGRAVAASMLADSATTISTWPCRCPRPGSSSRKTRRRFKPQSDFNVVRLSVSRLSFLNYERFSVPFPALLTALSCDLANGASRFTDYSQRRNPPILHRKELLLPADDPLVPEAAQLTRRLEVLGAVHRREDDRHPGGLAVAAGGVGRDPRGGRELASGRRTVLGATRVTARRDGRV